MIPKYPAIKTAPTAASLAAISSPFSEMLGFILFLIKSCATDVEITSSKPAAVESAAARPPAATNAITQSGNPAISGFAKTIMSLSIYSSFEFLDGVL